MMLDREEKKETRGFDLGLRFAYYLGIRSSR